MKRKCNFAPLSLRKTGTNVPANQRVNREFTGVMLGEKECIVKHFKTENGKINCNQQTE